MCGVRHVSKCVPRETEFGIILKKKEGLYSRAFWNADEKKDVHVPVDYCSEKLHDYFVDRKFRGESGNARKFFGMNSH